MFIIFNNQGNDCMKKLLAASVLFIGTLLSATQVNASVSFDFQELTDTSNGKIYGELANGDAFGSATNPLNPGENAFNSFNWTKDGITLTASAQYKYKNSNNVYEYRAAWAYLDKGVAGLGVCHAGLKGYNQCNPSNDDNVTRNEILNIAFDQQVSFNFIDSIFRDANHNTLSTGKIKYSIDSGSWMFLDLAALTGSGYIGKSFSFRTTWRTPQFYIDNVVVAKVPVTQVPEPSTLAIFALGIMGLASRRFKKQP